MASDDFQDKIKGGFMQKILLMTILIAIVLFADTTATYFWPIPGGEEVIVSNLGDFRPQSSYGSAHFHAGPNGARCKLLNFSLCIMALSDENFCL